MVEKHAARTRDSRLKRNIFLVLVRPERVLYNINNEDKY